MELSRRDKRVLAGITSRGRESARVIKRARALELLAEGWTGEATAAAVGMAPSTVDLIKSRYSRGGLERVLRDAPRGKPEEVLNARHKARIVAMVCGPAPEGEARWSVRLTASEAVDRGIVPKVGRETIRLLMHDHDMKPWREKNVVHSQVDVGIRGANGGPA